MQRHYATDELLKNIIKHFKIKKNENTKFNFYFVNNYDIIFDNKLSKTTGSKFHGK